MSNSACVDAQNPSSLIGVVLMSRLEALDRVSEMIKHVSSLPTRVEASHPLYEFMAWVSARILIHQACPAPSPPVAVPPLANARTKNTDRPCNQFRRAPD
jgi:hypothetical protein